MNMMITNDENTQSNQEVTPSRLDLLKLKCDELGVKYHPSIKDESKLEAKIAEAQAKQAEDEIEAMHADDPEEASPALSQEAIASTEDEYEDPMDHWKDFDLDAAQAAAMEKALNIDFSHITERPENKARFRFAGVHCFPKGNIERHEKKGWRLWEEAGSHSRYLDPSEIGNDKSSFVSVPVGSHTEGVQKLFLMYMPHKIYDATIGAVHKKNADDQLNLVKNPKVDEEQIVNADTGLTKTVKSGTRMEIKNEEAEYDDE